MTNDKRFFRFALTLSISVFLLVLLLNRRIIPAPGTYPVFVETLPFINAILNTICSILLISSFIAIKRKKIKLHKGLNITTFLLSSLFLISYLVYHYFIPEQTFGGEGVVRIFYYFVLLSHILLAAIVLPLILLSFYYALNNNIIKHRRTVRYAFPIWLYVTISGVVVYMLISPYYTF